MFGISTKDLQLRELKDNILQLDQRIGALLAAMAEANAREAERRQERDNLKEQVDFLTKKLFGSSSEKHHLEIPGQINLFNEAEQEQQQTAPEMPQDTIEIPAHTRRKKASQNETFKGIKVNKIPIPLSDEEKICPVCGTQMENR